MFDYSSFVSVLNHAWSHVDFLFSDPRHSLQHAFLLRNPLHQVTSQSLKMSPSELAYYESMKT